MCASTEGAPEQSLGTGHTERATLHLRTSPDITVAISGHPLTNTFYGATTLWLGRTRASSDNRRTKTEWAELNHWPSDRAEMENGKP